MNFTQIISALVVFIITSIIAYLFKKRQLYLALTNLYSNSTISDKGTICQLTIYNRGNSVEEDITIELNPNIPISLLSTDSSMLTHENSNNTISMSLLHKKSKASCMLLVENDSSLTLSDIQSFYSKDTKGIHFKSDNPNSNPPSLDHFAILLGVIAFVAIGFINLDSTVKFFENKYLNSKYSYLYSIGWSNLNRYSGTDLEEKSYTEKEFPIKFVDRKIDENDSTVVTYTFEIFNKTTEELEVTVNNPNYSQEQYKKDFNNYIQKPVHNIITPKQKKEKAEIQKLEADLKQVQKVLKNSQECNQNDVEKLGLTYELLATKIALKSIFLESSMVVSRKPFNKDMYLKVSVQPLSKAELKFTTKLSSHENLKFHMNWLNEFIYDIKYTPQKNSI